MTKFFFIALLITLAACKSETKKDIQEIEENPASSATATLGTTGKGSVDKVSFKVNGIDAQTQTKLKDSDEQIGLFDMPNKQLSFSLMGDDPARPHRGSLDFVIDDFQLAPGAYHMDKKNHVEFRRYETENAGGATSYRASSFPKFTGSQFDIVFTKVEKNEQAQFGIEYRVSGTFSAKLVLDPLIKESNDKVVEITEGKFEDVRISVLGAKK